MRQREPQRILVIDGHPDPDEAHYVHALAQAYARGATSAGHTATVLRIATLDFPLLRKPEEWLNQPAPAAIAAVQDQIRDAAHLVIIYPLWLGDVPALVKGFLEQAMRPGFALAYSQRAMPKKLLRGRSARVIVTMGMPGIAYRLYFRAHSLKSLERNILRFVGIAPVATTVIGGVDDAARREDWLERVSQMGARGE